MISGNNRDLQRKNRKKFINKNCYVSQIRPFIRCLEEEFSIYNFFQKKVIKSPQLVNKIKINHLVEKFMPHTRLLTYFTHFRRGRIVLLKFIDQKRHRWQNRLLKSYKPRATVNCEWEVRERWKKIKKYFFIKMKFHGFCAHTLEGRKNI